MENKLEFVSSSYPISYVHHLPIRQTCPYPLLFTHGMGGKLDQFNLSMECALQHGLEVYAMNLEGHGPDEEPKGCSSIRDYADNQRLMLQHIGRPTIIVSHSMSALSGQKVASELSGKGGTKDDALVKGAVFMSADPPKGITFFLKEMLWPRYLLPMLTEQQIRFLPKHVRRLMMNKTPNAEQYEHLRCGSGRAIWEIATGAISVNERDVKCPTLVIAPEEDRTTNPKLQEKISRKYGSDFVTIFGGDHFTFMWSTEPMEMIIGWIRYRGWFHKDIGLSQTKPHQLQVT